MAEILENLFKKEKLYSGINSLLDWVKGSDYTIKFERVRSEVYVTFNIKGDGKTTLSELEKLIKIGFKPSTSGLAATYRTMIDRYNYKDLKVEHEWGMKEETMRTLGFEELKRNKELIEKDEYTKLSIWIPEEFFT